MMRPRETASRSPREKVIQPTRVWEDGRRILPDAVDSSEAQIDAIYLKIVVTVFPPPTCQDQDRKPLRGEIEGTTGSHGMSA